MKLWIARDNNDGLYIHFTKPKGDGYWFISERFIRDAMYKGNADIKNILSKYFQVRSEDKFTKSGLCPGNLVSNCCYSTDGVSYFYNIKTLNFLDLETEVQTALNESREYKKWLVENKEDENDE